MSQRVLFRFLSVERSNKTIITDKRVMCDVFREECNMVLNLVCQVVKCICENGESKDHGYYAAFEVGICSPR